MTIHRFGGAWTDEKLDRLRKYLNAYMKIFTTNEKAKHLNTIYVDAFAGTGVRCSNDNNCMSLPLFNDGDVADYKKGSAMIALEIDPPFNEYIFVDHSPDHIEELNKLCLSYRSKYDNIKIFHNDANEFIQSWCGDMDWQLNRAVMFLDPYGMSVEWKTIETIACTKAIDLWLLFPLGQAVNRMLTRNRPPEQAWADRLTRFFGSKDWQESFYRKKHQMSLFESNDQDFVKTANFDSIGKYFIQRLKSIFAGVADTPLTLFNSRNVPIFLLCFAAGNKKGAPTAVRIAQHTILGRYVNDG